MLSWPGHSSPLVALRTVVSSTAVTSPRSPSTPRFWASNRHASNDLFELVGKKLDRIRKSGRVVRELFPFHVDLILSARASSSVGVSAFPKAIVVPQPSAAR